MAIKARARGVEPAGALNNSENKDGSTEPTGARTTRLRARAVVLLLVELDGRRRSPAWAPLCGFLAGAARRLVLEERQLERDGPCGGAP